MRIGDHEAGPNTPVSYRGYSIYVHCRPAMDVWLGSFTVWRAEGSHALAAAGNGQELGVFASDRAARTFALSAATRYIDKLREEAEDG